MKKRLISALLLAVLLLTVLAPLAGATNSMSSLYYVYTENGKPLNMRSWPDIAANIETTIPNGAQVYAQPYNNQWMRVSYGSKTGYCMSRYLVTWQPYPYPTAKPTVTPNIGLYRNMYRVNYYVTVRPSSPAGFVNMRWAPSTEEAVNNIYYANYRLHVIAQDNEWAQVVDEQNGYSGFMMLAFLTRTAVGMAQ